MSRLDLMYITNEVKVAKIAEHSGVNRIFVDLEQIGKNKRQHNMDTVQSKHTIDDVYKIKSCLSKAQLITRINSLYDNSITEVNECIKNGTDIIMLPYFKTPDEVNSFLRLVDKRVKTCLLLETSEAVECVDEILELDGIDEIHIGLNDLHLSYKLNFMFELFTNGIVEMLCKKFRHKGIRFGIGGIASIGTGSIPAEIILKEHHRLGSKQVILSRSFCNYASIFDEELLRLQFEMGISEIRNLENEIEQYSNYFLLNRKKLEYLCRKISAGMSKER